MSGESDTFVVGESDTFVVGMPPQFKWQPLSKCFHAIAKENFFYLLFLGICLFLDFGKYLFISIYNIIS